MDIVSTFFIQKWGKSKWTALCGALPAAFAVDVDPPLYEQFGYDSPEAFLLDYGAGRWDYDTFADRYRQRYEAILADPQIALDYYGYASLEELDQDIAEWQTWESREAFYRDVAVNLTWNDEWEYVPPVSVQLNGESVAFPDAQPETVNSRTMVPFRAIAEALGAQVGYADGTVTAEKDGVRYELAAGSDRMRVLDAQDGTVIREIRMDTAPYEKGGRTDVPVRFFAQAFGLTVQWDEREQTGGLFDEDLAQQVGLIQEQLENVRFEMIYDADTDTLYLRCPLLCELLVAAAPDGGGAELAPETWFRVDDLMGYALGLTSGELPDSLAAMGSGMTVGGLLLAQAEQDCGSWDNYSELWDGVHWEADWAAGYAADDKFTQSGARYTAALEDSSEDAEWGESYYIKGAYTLDTQSGAVTGAFEIRDTTSYGDTLTNFSFEFADASGQLTISVHEKNQSITEMTIDLTQQVSDTAPAAEPPAGDPVIDLIDWYNSLWLVEDAA